MVSSIDELNKWPLNWLYFTRDLFHSDLDLRCLAFVHFLAFIAAVHHDNLRLDILLLYGFCQTVRDLATTFTQRDHRGHGGHRPLWPLHLIPHWTGHRLDASERFLKLLDGALPIAGVVSQCHPGTENVTQQSVQHPLKGRLLELTSLRSHRKLLQGSKQGANVQLAFWGQGRCNWVKVFFQATKVSSVGDDQRWRWKLGDLKKSIQSGQKQPLSTLNIFLYLPFFWFDFYSLKSVLSLIIIKLRRHEIKPFLLDSFYRFSLKKINFNLRITYLIVT